LLLALGPDNSFELIWHTAICLALSQPSLLGLWLAFGKTKLFSRLLVCVAMLLAIAFVLAYAGYGLILDLESEFAIFCVALVGGAFASVAIAAFVMRRTGVEVALVGDSQNASMLLRIGSAARLQFSMLDLLLFTSGVAVVTVGFAKLREASAVEELDAMGWLFLANVPVTAATAFAALTQASWRWRMAVLLLTLPIAAPLYFAVEVWVLSIIQLSAAAATIASLLVMRFAGYRLVIRDRAITVAP
jgi:hypothetical protein